MSVGVTFEPCCLRNAERCRCTTTMKNASSWSARLQALAGSRRSPPRARIQLGANIASLVARAVRTTTPSRLLVQRTLLGPEAARNSCSEGGSPPPPQ